MANSSILRDRFKVLCFCCLLLAILSLQGCAYYTKPVYSGRVIDAEDGTPLAGVQIEVEYWVKHQTLVEKNTKKIHTYQTITNYDGYFEIPSYKTIKSPFSWDGFVLFSFRKIGYVYIGSMNLAECLSTGCEKKNFKYLHDNSKIYFVSSHLIELPKI
ncbi:hypothetical protein [Geoalkalibacter sp.]|uniref:hypothetical protein n=1 Tax=Geoalkalibacter sp. TaxID=3041440 RepID=UPI00272E3735|nr:hypothetical protein [Geoalkalibacter sp.]